MTRTIPSVIGHRGASLEAPENTLPSLRRAIDLGAGGVEFDVQLTRDRVPVVIHDETVDRTTDGTGHVRNLTMDRIRELDAGSWKHRRFRDVRVPTLDEALQVMGRRAVANLELKTNRVTYHGIEDAVGRAIEEHGLVDRAVVTSFNPGTILRFHDRYPDVAKGALIAGELSPQEARDAAPIVDVLGLQAGRITRRALDLAQDHDLPVVAWTVNSTRRARRLLDAGVAGVITDDPRRILRAAPTPA